MGGPGSGNFYHRWRPHKKAAVEECLTLNTSFLARNRYLAAGVYSTGSVQWGTDPAAPWVSFVVDTLDDDRPTLTLKYRVGRDPGPPVSYRGRLAATRPPFGGLRWWFLCPVVGCGRRAAKLYRPPGARYFACRACHRLTYTSCQDSHRFDAVYRHLAANMGVDLGTVKWALNQLGKRCDG